MERVELRSLVLSTGGAVERGEFVFLRDPKAGPGEQAQFEELIQAAGVSCSDGRGWLCVPTGGTSGGLRFARHDEQTLGEAVRGFCRHYNVRRINVVDVLPAHHVSSLMARVRCAVTGCTHLSWSWKQLEEGAWPKMTVCEEGWFLSLVPTQLQRLLTSPAAVERLKSFRTVFIGGGPLWPELAEAAAAAGVPVSVCYGMTETAAMIAAQPLGAFAAGDRSCGSVMSHAKVEIVSEVTGGCLSVGETGLVRISGESLFRGYWPGMSVEQALLTEDLGWIDEEGRLHIVGRRDAVIITGGKKVSPDEVERVVRSSGEFTDVAVIGLPDPEWGQLVVACYPPRVEKLDTRKIEAALESLAAYQRPKRFLAIAPWPRNPQGKLNRAVLQVAAVAALAVEKTEAD